MKIKLLYFISLVDDLGKSEETLDIPSSINTIDKLLKYLSNRDKKYQDIMKINLLNITVNKKFANDGNVIRDNDEIAFIPKTMS
ncbi:MAG: hypothetical protein DRQ51_04990 [Gammaproteobacteria bacterium]|nr:MAG: hypothetical protein DRQ51_04990 [Gammaproteobacteria bacterium]